MEILFELLSILLLSFGINMIPFASPSNLLIASNASLLVDADPLSIGIMVALGATCAKLIHYILSFFVGKHVGEERRKRLDIASAKVRKWAFLTVFAVAATPVPDDPVVIPLGLMKYSPAKFSLAYFTGKLCIAILGAFLGGLGEQLLSGFLDQVTLAIVSVVLTIAITVVLLKIDIGGVARKIFGRGRRLNK